MRYEKLNLQMCLRTQTVLDEYLHYEESEQIDSQSDLLQKNMPGSLSDFRKRKNLSFDEALKFFLLFCSLSFAL